ncbi:MAG: hypothetical protein KKE73_06205 [Proteobacteria bacterium]|nr:hypothetical protein [Pseudomonadota bacterium]
MAKLKENSDTPPVLGKVRVRTAADLRRFLARIINELRTGTITAGDARAYGYLAQVMSGILTASDLEARIEALETEVKNA